MHQKGKRKHLRFTDAIKESVELLLQDDYNPEQVVGFFLIEVLVIEEKHLLLILYPFLFRFISCVFLS